VSGNGNGHRQLALMIDIDRCIGCHACTVVCQEEHNDPREVKRLRVPTVGSGHHDIPAGVYPNVWMYFEPRMCQHCVNPPCIASCPFDAIEKGEDGVVRIIDANCTGCMACVPACPYGVIEIKEEERLVAMCDMCSSRLAVGLRPACVGACPGDAIFFGDIYDEDSDINVQRRQVPKHSFELAGGGHSADRPSTFYQSRKPKRPEDPTIVEVDR
jgi:Fe-S-cluster-containing dehydrogenase component